MPETNNLRFATLTIHTTFSLERKEKIMTRLIRNIAASLFLTVLALSLSPYLGAQTTLDQQKRTARIYANGTVENGSDWLTAVNNFSGGYLLTFKTPFTAPPNCVVTPEQSSSSFWGFALIQSTPTTPQSLTSIQVRTFTPGAAGIGYTSTNVPFRILCMPDQTVATSSATWDQAGNLLFNPNNWISSVTLSATGQYTVTFTTPYVTAPTCVVTPSLGGSGNPPSLGSTAEIQVTPTFAFVTTQYFSQTGFIGSVNITTNLTCTGQQ